MNFSLLDLPFFGAGDLEDYWCEALNRRVENGGKCGNFFHIHTLGKNMWSLRRGIAVLSNKASMSLYLAGI